MYKILSLIFPVLLLLMSAKSQAQEIITDMGRAMEYCKNAPLDKVEGIWEFSADNTVVLIRRDKKNVKVLYDLIIITTPDCRLKPGDRIGTLTPTVDNKKFQLSLFGKKQKGIMTDSRMCAAVFNDRNGTMKIEPRKVKFKLSSRIYRFLPEFWRIISFFSTDNPAADLPDGLIRIYPQLKRSADGSLIYL